MSCRCGGCTRPPFCCLSWRCWGRFRSVACSTPGRPCTGNWPIRGASENRPFLIPSRRYFNAYAGLTPCGIAHKCEPFVTLEHGLEPHEAPDEHDRPRLAAPSCPSAEPGADPGRV